MEKTAMRRGVFFFAVIILFIWPVSCYHRDEKCIASRKTVDTVQFCPESLSSWKGREKEKNCSSIAHNCSRRLVYHCLIDPWQNKLLEVCAPVTEINAGHCAEYNPKGGRIQDYISGSCRLCEKNYNSSEAQQYQECYNVIYKKNNNQMESTIATNRQSVKYNHNNDERESERFNQNTTNGGNNVQPRSIYLFLSCFLVFYFRA